MDNINLMHILLIFLITIIIDYLFGIILVNLIDNRLSKIKIDIPQQDIVIKYPTENFDNSSQSVQNVQKVQNNPIILSNKSGIEGFSNSRNEKNKYKGWDIEKKKVQACIKDHKHKRDGSCTYGLTNYADPNDMSPIDLKIFILNYPSNMTLQDYINWLMCYKDKEDQLPYNHLKNLEKIKIGKELIEEEGILPPPSYNYPKMNAEDYFDKMYNNTTNEFSTAPPLNSNTATMLGYNCDAYSEFSQNLDLYGSTGQIRNTDIALKKNAKKLYDYINPKDSNSLNINKENEIYHIKKVEV